MNTHKLARLTPRGRLEMVRRLATGERLSVLSVPVLNRFTALGQVYPALRSSGGTRLSIRRLRRWTHRYHHLVTRGGAAGAHYLAPVRPLTPRPRETSRHERPPIGSRERPRKRELTSRI